MNADDEMIKYVRPSRVCMFLLMPFSFVVSASVGVAALAGFFSGENVYLCLLILCIGLLLMWLAISPFRDYRKMMKFFTDGGIYHEATADFLSAQSFMNDNMRMGNKYIFSRRLCTVIRYGDIRRLYQSGYEANGAERARELKAVDISGQNWHLCVLTPDTDNQPGLKEAVDFMLSKNSRIVIDF